MTETQERVITRKEAEEWILETAEQLVVSNKGGLEFLAELACNRFDHLNSKVDRLQARVETLESETGLS